MWNPSKNNSFLSKTQSSMPPSPPHDFTDTESTDIISAYISGSQGCFNMEWMTTTNDESKDEQLNYTENGMALAQLGGGGGELLSGDHQLVESGHNDSITNTPPAVNKQTRSAVKKKTAFEKIKKELLELHYGKTLLEAAKSLKVSVPTLKRICRKHGIPSWPLSKKKKKELCTEISNIDEVQQFPAELRTVIAKVKYGDNFIKFEIPSASNFAVLQEEITKRLNLKDGSFNIKYVDEDGDPVLIINDDDVRMCMKTLDTPKVNMEVLPCSK